MKSVTCDGCGQSRPQTEAYLWGVLKLHERNAWGDRSREYIDPETKEPASGRMTEYDLCLGCLNLVEVAAFAKFKSLQKSFPKKGKKADENKL